MRDFLQEIVAKKRERLNHPFRALRGNRFLDFGGNSFILPPGSVIAEVKRASPSQGAIDMALDPAALAREYERRGAAAISVLTEEDYFHGSLADLDAVRAAVKLPVLRKDFVIDERQIDETAGRADALLLIVRLLDASTLACFIARCRALAIEPIVEVYDEADIGTLKEALVTPSKSKFLFVGINNRDLKTFTVDLANAGRLAAKLPPGCVPIAFSGVGSAANAAALRAAGLSRALVGTALVKDPELLTDIKRELA